MKWKCGNCPLFKNIKLLLSSRDSFLTCHGVLYLPLLSHSCRQRILLGHVRFLTGSRALQCKLACLYEPPPAGRFSLLLVVPNHCDVEPGIFPSLSHGGWATKMWLKPLPWDTYPAEGWAKGHLLDYVVNWRQGRLLSCPSLRPYRNIYLTLTLPVPVASPMPRAHNSGY